MPSQLTYDVFVAEPIPQNVREPIPNGERRMFSPLSITLISGENDAVLVDPPLTIEQTEQVAGWVEASGKNLTHVFATHGHGDHWFGGAQLAERFGATFVATPGTIEQMRLNVALRPVFWDALFPGQIPQTDVTAVPAVDNMIELEGHQLFVVEVGHSDTDDTSVLHVPALSLVVAGDVVYNGVHQFLREAAGDGIKRWHEAIDAVAALEPRYIVTGHKNEQLDDAADRTIAETRSYLNAAAELLTQEDTALGFFNAMLQRFPDRLNAGALWGSATALYPEPA
ncbi:MBL fold metallo-hydrolase [Kribbella sp. NPDC003505]|uniref:MBL fold metallo-hydrolase n=1 Tax=Kribbella sp. NPDC003505 TaxID=3154448 RepID=UPI0033A639E7